MRARDKIRPHQFHERQEVVSGVLKFFLPAPLFQKLENPRLVRGFEMRQLALEVS